ncbi:MULTISPECIES: type II toxin-antitoxin system death-on-curing family toxin [Bacillus]|uniref:Phage killer protein n=2 Tax=Bacillus TaxID=1386 RepID=A0A0M4FE46_9BACI|nr:MULTISPECIES: type II toxin-antitoxin system death-on-curing family toxin [Bacillus]ALC80361.1 phage killer protein [Bacillus gobiensis]MBP1083793.1 death-on-curing protein [Bacillus capparidis]MED1098278.1 type II toxin-antitoxin system death-on-curing family toxin [Bacillus capparidis]
MRFLTIQEVIALNKYLIQTLSPGELIGVKEPSLLESAVYRPQSSAFGEDAYPTLFEKGAALFESLAQNHAFQNANKRTALLSLTFFLRYNGYHFEMTTEDKIEFTVSIVKKEISFEHLVSIIREHSKEIME